MTNAMKRAERKKQEKMWNKLSTVAPHLGIQHEFLDLDINSMYSIRMQFGLNVVEHNKLVLDTSGV